MSLTSVAIIGATALGLVPLASPIPKGGVSVEAGGGQAAITGRVNPEDRQKPRYYPQLAEEELVEGAVVLQCIAAPQVNGLSGCRVIDEAPIGYGFAEAAISMVPKMKSSKNELNKEYAVIVPFVFKFDHPVARSVPKLVIKPDWLKVDGQKIMGAALERYSPELKEEAWSAVLCSITTRGNLEKCRALAEGPEGRGVGAAASWFAEQLAMKPNDLNGQPTAGGSILLKLRFNP